MTHSQIAANATTIEFKIGNTLRTRGLKRSEADTEAFGYTKAFMKGEVEPELIADLTGMPIEEVREMARELARTRMQKRR